jgi:glycine dehydrogenase subunit 1
LGGVSLGRLYPDVDALANGLLVAVTEAATMEDVGTFAAALQEVLA